MRINLDMLKTRHREKIFLDACIEAQQPFVIDNTNPTRADRARYINELKQQHFKIKAYYFVPQFEDALVRNKLRAGKEQIPEVGIKSTYNKLEPPSIEEGFDELFYVTLKGHEFIVRSVNASELS